MDISQSYKEPFWASPVTFMTGRDPLGIQNSSNATYSRILPGMTNLTMRLRYYGFYCWLLQEFYALQDGKTDFTKTDQYTFIRRGELIIAYLMRTLAPEVKSVVGSDFTSKFVESFREDGIIDIAIGADQTPGKKEPVYWKVSSGALGQYYAGALQNLGLIAVVTQFFDITEKGSLLANAFSADIDEDHQALFISCIESGQITFSDLEQLQGFKLNVIKEKSQEYNYYLNLMVDIDGVNLKGKDNKNTTLRKNSLELLLQYFNKEETGFDERRFVYTQFSNKIANPASTVWGYYYLNECSHFALQSIFWSLLVMLDEKSYVLDEFFDRVIDETMIHLQDSIGINADTSLFDTIAALDGDIEEKLNALQRLTKNDVNYPQVLGHAFTLLFLLYEEVSNNQESYIATELELKIANNQGRLTDNMNVYVDQMLSLNMKEFIKLLLKKLMNNHINVAYRKMGNGERNLLKFLVEDGIISHIQTLGPTHTSPRLRAFTNFMQDLSLVNSDYQLLPLGTSMLQNLTKAS